MIFIILLDGTESEIPRRTCKLGVRLIVDSFTPTLKLIYLFRLQIRICFATLFCRICFATIGFVLNFIFQTISCVCFSLTHNFFNKTTYKKLLILLMQETVLQKKPKLIFFLFLLVNFSCSQTVPPVLVLLSMINAVCIGQCRSRAPIQVHCRWVLQ